MTLWLFGDSFVQNSHTKGSWAQRVLERFPHLGPASDHAWCSSGLGYTYEKWEENREMFKPGDVAVIGLTCPRRCYFFPDIPGWCYPTSIDTMTGHDTSNEKKTAFELYFRYLRREEQERTNLVNFLHAVHDTNIRAIVLPCFPETEEIVEQVRHRFPGITIAKGNLHEVARAEISEGLDYPTLDSPDRRNNHICRTNHVVLANKIISAMETSKSPDLREGFLQGFVTKSTLNDPEWRIRELSDE